MQTTNEKKRQRARLLISEAKKIYDRGYSFGLPFKAYAREFFKKWPDRRSYGSTSDFFLGRWAEMGREYAERAGDGNGGIFEIFEARRCEAIMDIIDASQQLGHAYINALKKECGVDDAYLLQTDPSDSGWECVGCSAELSIDVLTRSMSYVGVALCSACLRKEM